MIRKSIRIFAPIVGTMLLATYMTIPVFAWNDGGCSIDPNNPKFGTHDLMLQKAIGMLPHEMSQKIDMTAAYYGTELPDCYISNYYDHGLVYYADGNIQRDGAALGAKKEYNFARSALRDGDKYNFSLHIGIMSHYISDVSVYAHTMGRSTDWGMSAHESEYESYVQYI